MAFEAPSVWRSRRPARALVYIVMISLIALLPAIAVENASMPTRIIWSMFAIALGPVVVIGTSLVPGAVRLSPGAPESLLLVFATLQICSVLFLSMSNMNSHAGEFAKIVIDFVRPIYWWVDYYREIRVVDPLLRLKIEALACIWFICMIAVYVICLAPHCVGSVTNQKHIPYLNPKHIGSITRIFFFYLFLFFPQLLW